MTPDFFKLCNNVKHYEWGSPEWIPRLLGQSNSVVRADDSRPWAELWMGAHPGSPSRVVADGKEQSLAELIAENPRYYVGEQAAERYGALPFLLKLLAAERPLSIQAHPNLSQAREGFERENRLGIALDSPSRNYKDPNHKPEIICALTPFTGMCGFREPGEIKRLIAAFLDPPGTPPTPAPAALREGCAPLLQALDNSDALRGFLAALFGLPPAVREELTAYINRSGATNAAADTGEHHSDSTFPAPEQWELMRRFAGLYPNDPALLSPLYLNIFNLEPGEAVFLKAGTLHAYIHGLGVELMANSDNVLRGGLSPKHIDVPELMNVLDFTPLKPKIIQPPSPPQSCFTYPALCEEFSLSVMHGVEAGADIGMGAEKSARAEADADKSTTGETPFPMRGPAICVVTAGTLSIQGSGGQPPLAITSGESVFIPAGGNGGRAGEEPRRPLTLRGDYTLYAATLPQAAALQATLPQGGGPQVAAPQSTAPQATLPPQ